MSTIVWTEDRSENQHKGFVGTAHLFTICEGSGVVTQVLDLDGTPRGPSFQSKPWQLQHRLPISSDTRWGAIVVKAGSVEEAKETADNALADFLELLGMPDSSTVSRLTFDANRVPPADLSYDPKRVVHVERLSPERDEWVIRHGADGPVLKPGERRKHALPRAEAEARARALIGL